VSAAAELMAWQYGVDLARAGRRWIAVVASPKRIRAELPEEAIDVRNAVGHDSFARWVHLGWEDANRAPAERGMEL
jgi:hypothetical protein